MKIYTSLCRISLFISLLIFASCQKELSYESPLNPVNPIPADSLAVFSILPTSSSCSDAVVQGTINKGVQISTAQITFTVNVTKKGKWAMTTGVVNGFVFVGAGDFPSTGKQTITLYAAGTPLTSGISQFPIKAGSSTCNIPVTVVDGGGTTTGTYYYKFTAGDTTYIQYASVSNGYIAGSGSEGTDDVALSAVISYMNDPAPAGTTAFSISKGVMHNYRNATDAIFKAYFPVGDLTYALPDPIRADGIVITWQDNKEEFWTTTSGTGDQSGSTFKIISVKDGRDYTGVYYVEVKMQFECTLYNDNTGKAKKITKGEMVGIFGKI